MQGREPNFVVAGRQAACKGLDKEGVTFLCGKAASVAGFRWVKAFGQTLIYGSRSPVWPRLGGIKEVSQG